MKLIGLTGGIATGKSTVSKMLTDLGQKVVDADLLAREVVEPHSFGLEGLIGVFGRKILSSDGALNRAALADLIFSDQEAKKVVENITHPLIHWRAQQEFSALRKQGLPVAFYDAALIFERNLTPIFDEILVVRTDMETQVQRLVKRDNLTRERALKRLEAQWPIEKKAALAHRIIDNSGDVQNTRKQVEELVAGFK